MRMKPLFYFIALISVQHAFAQTDTLNGTIKARKDITLPRVVLWQVPSGDSLRWEKLDSISRVPDTPTEISSVDFFKGPSIYCGVRITYRWENGIPNIGSFMRIGEKDIYWD